MEPAPDRLGQGLSAAHDEGLPGDGLGLIRSGRPHRIHDVPWLTKRPRGHRPFQDLEIVFAGVEASGAADAPGSVGEDRGFLRESQWYDHPP
jgi:hypothetical protein